MKLSYQGNKIIIEIEPGDCSPGVTPSDMARALVSEASKQITNPLVGLFLKSMIKK
jgi:hypothetical protein